MSFLFIFEFHDFRAMEMNDVSKEEKLKLIQKAASVHQVLYIIYKVLYLIEGKWDYN